MDNFMFIENKLNMDKIIKKDGFVFLVEEHDSQGRFNTYYNLGKDIDDPRWEEKDNEEKPKQKKGRIKKDEE